ncbi:MAG: response regulator transcription factor [Chloroflexi bacterium]|nr:response regulator transcription factor [Chloroflexota bacterium]
MKVLVADDDKELVELLGYALKRDGHRVISAFDGLTALQLYQIEKPDLLLLDVNMPKRSGLEVLRELRLRSKVPILMLTVHADEDSVVHALELGADDYVYKPFRPRELRARVHALFRRHQDWPGLSVSQSEKLAFGGISLDPVQHQVRVRGKPAKLTPTEFSLLHFLMLNRDGVVPPASIMTHVWGYDSDETDDVVRVFIMRLRHKIEMDPAHPRLIVNEPGVGYMFQTEEH